MKSQAQGPLRALRLAAAAGCVALVGAAAAACAAKVDHKAPEDESTVTQLSTPRHRHFRGPVSVVIEAARDHAELGVEQRQTLDTIVRELEEDRGSWRELRGKLKRSALAIVRSGSADSEAFEQSVSEAVRAVEQRVQRNTDALEEIHAILTPEQRSAVATALRAQIEKRLGQRDGQQRHREGFRRFASQLMLSKLQLAQLEAIKTELLGEKQQLHPTREELFALVDAFEGDGFGTALGAFRAKKAIVLRARIASAGKRTDTVLSILTREQRELLADLILEGPHKVLFGEEHEQAPTP
jgi:Spy/CpxP family protein refolding chaperone